MWDWIAKAHELNATGATFALVTVTGIKGSAPRGAGAKMIVLPDGTFFGSVGGGALEAEVLGDAARCLEEAQAAPRRYPLCFRTGQCCGGAADVYIEVVGLGPRLYVFGAGHVAQSLCQTLVGTPYRVHVVDQRGEWLAHPDLPASVTRHGGDWRAFVETAEWEAERTYALVMTHDHQLDLDIVADLAARPARFIGLIGSRAKWERFQRMLPQMGRSAADVARITCPIGLGFWGKAPREIAISVGAQLLQMHHEGIATSSHESKRGPEHALYGQD
jgi:xanthine dehydrogenase accessory factor